MASRGRMQPNYGGRSVQAPGMMRHGPFPSGRRLVETLSPNLAEDELAIQEAEIKRLAGENRRLAASHVALKQDIVAAQQDIQRLREHTRSLEAENNIQIRVLLDKIAKMDVDLRAGESIKKDLQQAHIEAQSLEAARNELTAQIQKTTQELDKARSDVKKLPEMHAELDSLREEHQRLRKTYEYEKGLNMEKVEQMQAMEKELEGMAREVEKLCSEMLNADKRAREPNPYGWPYISRDPLYPPPPMHGSVGYVESCGRPRAQEGMVPYGGGGAAAASGGVGGAPPFRGGGSYARGGGAYDASHAGR